MIRLESLDGLGPLLKAVLLDALQYKAAGSRSLTARERLLRQGIIFNHRGCAGPRNPRPQNDPSVAQSHDLKS